MQVDQQKTSAPPLGVNHLLMLTVGVAFAIAIQVRGLELTRNAFDSQALNAFQLVLMVCSSLVNGLALAGLIWLFDWRRRQGPFSLQPGHWLIISWGVTMLVASATQLVLFSLIGFEWPRPSLWLMIVPAMFQIVQSVVVLGLACVRTSGIWRYLMAALLLKSSSHSMLTILILNGGRQKIVETSYYAAAVSQFLPFVFLLAAIIWDLIKTRRRDWMHYCGVALLVGQFLVEVASMVYYRFFYQ